MKSGLARPMVLVAAVCLLAACAKKAEPAPAPPAAAPKPPLASNEEVWTAEQLAFLREKFGDLQQTNSGLYYKILQPGRGEEKPPRAKLCTVNYRGTMLDGRVFDESARHGGPFKFRVGLGRVIKGWDESVADMRRGEKRLVIVPYWLGYGVKGQIPVIMPRATLVFEIELLDWETTTKVPGTE